MLDVCTRTLQDLPRRSTSLGACACGAASRPPGRKSQQLWLLHRARLALDGRAEARGATRPAASRLARCRGVVAEGRRAASRRWPGGLSPRGQIGARVEAAAAATESWVRAGLSRCSSRCASTARPAVTKLETALLAAPTLVLRPRGTAGEPVEAEAMAVCGGGGRGGEGGSGRGASGDSQSGRGGGRGRGGRGDGGRGRRQGGRGGGGRG